VRGGLRQFIDAEPRFKVVAEACDGEEAVQKIHELHPEIAILDIDMPKLDGFGVARAIQKSNLPVEIIFLTIHSAEDLFNEAMDLGAKGYLLKRVLSVKSWTASRQSRRQALSQSGNQFLSHSTQYAYGDLAKQKSGLDTLTPAERRILQLIAADKSSKEIADELFINTEQ